MGNQGSMYQTSRMPRLVIKFASRTCHCVGFVVLRLSCARNRLGILDGWMDDLRFLRPF